MADRATLTKPTTVDEFDHFAALPENVGHKLQLVDGEIIEEMPKFAHARIASRLILWLGKFFEEHPIGEVFAELRIALPDELINARIPDICVVIGRQDELAGLGVNDALPFMPDLIIEIQSEGQTDRYMSDLADYYLERGCRMVWIIYPDLKLVEWLTPTERHLLLLEGTISGGDVLPGLSVSVAKLFA
ncbi:MAG: Uma2 family endonuclease [Anaerolineae bacterium]|nr:Uma2 family endonuclease [Anaerolineae bacterium]